MSTKLFRPGRPKKDNSLTPAQKQAAYRERLRIVRESQEVNFICTIDQFNEQKKEIERLTNELARLNDFIKEFVDYCGLYASVLPREAWVKQAKDMFNKKSNVTKTYK